jgi:queuine tRNA-ribosyltransferase
VGTGPKSETTVALTKTATAQPWASSYTLLGDEWLARWHRSDSKVPFGVEREHFLAQGLDKAILHHSQFSALN